MVLVCQILCSNNPIQALKENLDQLEVPATSFLQVEFRWKAIKTYGI